MGKWIQRALACLLTALMLAPAAARAAEPYESYIYDEWKQAVPTQSGYTVADVIQLAGMAEEIVPVDLYHAPDKSTYVLDNAGGRVLILDEAYRQKGQIAAFSRDGADSPLNQPSGLFVTQEGLYIADTGNNRVILSDFEGRIQQVFLRPESDQYPANMDFRPLKVLADTVGNLYVLCEGGYFGAVIYDTGGNFTGFYGGNKVEATLEVLINRFWKGLMTKEQTDRFERYVPLEYTSFDVDDENSVYVCVSSKTDGQNRLKKLNPGGKNILPSGWYGDEKVSTYGGVDVETSFVDIAADADYHINALDYARKRVFQYDRDGNLLFVFGGEGDHRGAFYAPAAVETAGDDVLVLDRDKAAITRFVPTEFGAQVRTAMRLYNDGRYKEAVPAWEETLRLNAYYPLAYTGIGKARMMDKEYAQAMRYFELGAERELYSEAYAEIRKGTMRTIFPLLAVLLAVVMLGTVMVINPNSRLRRAFAGRSGRPTAPKNRGVRVMFRQLVHPIDNGEDMRWNKTGSLGLAVGVMAALVIAAILQEQTTAFVFNTNDTFRFSIFSVLFRTVVIFFAFIVANWSICTLLDGEGRFRDIWISTAYALIPLVICMLLSTVLSHMLIFEEKAFLDILLYAGIGWSVFAGVCSLMVVHQYTFPKTILSIVFSLLIMVFMLFLAILLFGLVQEIASFVITIFRELLVRF